MRGPVIVVGSLNADVNVLLDRMPERGETVLGEDVTHHPGGKGLNQAVAAARFGAAVHLVGAVGSDAGGEMLRDVAAREGIDVGSLVTLPGASGTALIEVEPDGANRIVVIRGANARLSPQTVREAIAAVADPAVVLVQCEIPIEAIEAAMEAGRAAGALTILNPAPVVPLSHDLLTHVDVIVPNEHEAELLTGLPTNTLVDAQEAAALFNEQGIAYGIITRGSHGSVWSTTAHGAGSTPTYPVTAVDTVSAGDAFCGVLAAALAEGHDFQDAMRSASAAGALATTVVGAVSCLPTRAQIDALRREHGE